MLTFAGTCMLRGFEGTLSFAQRCCKQHLTHERGQRRALSIDRCRVPAMLLAFSAVQAGSDACNERKRDWLRTVGSGACLLPVLLATLLPVELSAAPSPTFKLPPVDMTDPNRCKLSSSTIGQANAARDKFIDARFCDLRGQDFSGYDLSGVLLEGATADEARFKSTQLSKAYAPRFTCRKCDFEDAVVDRVNFEDADLTGSVFKNAVLSDSVFNEGTVVRDVDFTDVYVGEYGLKRLCKNPHLDGENPITGAPTRASLGCRPRD
ncbi:hypothetical protein F1559_002303 [Cyanidiococcus yangmingshanensis]|uniref:Pentapeptide repeat-containing protein n=1 Tax=Cyanidiococcus yangmingshanensis TaxID=2690220 RepID=A0A7J7INY9_9RHOD|nr:hypothetical protein F1559_002303 [Cyanidiococcus yangmingshanensis]